MTTERQAARAPEPFLRVRGLHVHFVVADNVLRRARRQAPELLRAVDGVDLDVGRAEAVGLVGESGCGKSTLARSLAGIQAPTSGTVEVDGRALGTGRRGSEARRLQMVFQDPYSSLNPRMTVRQTLAELLRAHRLVPRAAIDARASELVELVGLSQGALDAQPRQLSGGQRQRVAIARALALEPDVLVADEPTSALDVSVEASVLRLFAELRASLGLTLLFISHNMAVVRQVCDRVAVMYLGRIVEQGPAREVFAEPRHPYTRALVSAVPRLVPGRASEAIALPGDPPSPVHLPSGCRFHPRCPIAQPVCADISPELAAGPAGPPHEAACHFAWDAAPAPQPADERA
jgi:peptide/nickel transport system ATP-binding protein